MRIFTWLKRQFMNTPDEMLEHVPVQGRARGISKKLTEARKRHGKEFRSHTLVERQIEPSEFLRRLNGQKPHEAEIKILNRRTK